LDMTRLEQKIKAVEGRAGQSSLDPRLLRAVWIYGHSEGSSAARELSRMCEYEPGCQWLTGMQGVNYHTLADFRVDHKDELDGIFVEVLGLLSAEGCIEMKRITQDGTKVKAQAGANSFRRGGFAPSYNVQICTDAANGIIVGVDVTQAGNDCDQLVNGVERVEANTGQTPEQV